jgi:hypothetical protein
VRDGQLRTVPDGDGGGELKGANGVEFTGARGDVCGSASVKEPVGCAGWRRGSVDAGDGEGGESAL